MIKLGPLAIAATNKKYPNNWISLARMTRIPYEYDSVNNEIVLELSPIAEIVIHKDGSFSTTANLSNELIAQIFIAITKEARAKNVQV